MNKISKFNIIVVFIYMLVSFGYSKDIMSMPSVQIANKIGYTMSKEKYTSQIDINTKQVDNKLKTRIQDYGFKFKSALVDWYTKQDNQFRVKGVVIHQDAINRDIQTRFDAVCTIYSDKSIVINNLSLSNNAKPRTEFYIVPVGQININNLKNYTFRETLNKVNTLSKKINDFNVPMDSSAQEYELIAFIMNKLDKDDEIYSVVSNAPYSSHGISQGKLVKTKDGWYISVARSKFAYNNGLPYFFNILLSRGNKVYATQSYSTHGLIKVIQEALVLRGYNISKMDGELNLETQQAINNFIHKYKFDKSTKITSSLLWFMQQREQLDIIKVVQATLKKHGKNVGKIDGQIGKKTIRALKEYQKMLGVNADGKITPELVYMLLQTSQNTDIYRQIRSTLNIPILLKDYRNRMWPNKI